MIRIVCTVPGYVGIEEIVDRENECNFEKDIGVYGEPGISYYSKDGWKKKGVEGMTFEEAMEKCLVKMDKSYELLKTEVTKSPYENPKWVDNINKLLLEIGSMVRKIERLYDIQEDIRNVESTKE